MITGVTITAADDSIKPEQLLNLSRDFPFVEWEILVSRTSSGTRRFPSLRWIDKLVEVNNEAILSGCDAMNISLHLCGQYVRELLQADGEFIDEELIDIWAAFGRVQINTHAETHLISPKFTDVLNQHRDKEFIFQYDNVNADELITLSKDAGVNFSALFDLSHGAGIVPQHWPSPLDVKCGYAGGIGPDNITEQMDKINFIVKDVPTWIDMETKVRSTNDTLFDMGLVKDCLVKAETLLKFKFKVAVVDGAELFERELFGTRDAVTAEANVLFGADKIRRISQILS